MREKKKQVQEAGYIHGVNVLRKSLYYGLFLEHLLIHSKLNCHILFSCLLPTALKFRPRSVIVTSPLHRDANAILMNSVTFV